MTYKNFERDILAMNATYKLPQTAVGDWDAVSLRLKQFEDILSKECAELGDIQSEVESAGQHDDKVVDLSVVVNLADLLGDLIVYCASEAARWGIPLPQVLQIIMASNTSKLGADGQPIINPENGKFEKGPNYWKPEPAIAHLLRYGGEGMTFTRSHSGVTTVEMWEPGSNTGGGIDMDAVTAAALQPGKEEGNKQ